MGSHLHRLLKNAHLRRSPHPSSLQRTFKYASLLRISGALHLGIFDQPEKMSFSTGYSYGKGGRALFSILLIQGFDILLSPCREFLV
jgi:hypothetical protein